MRRTSAFSSFSFVPALLALACLASQQLRPQTALAEDSFTVTARGIAGDEDKHFRNPTLTVTHEIVAATATESSRVRILADAQVIDDQYTKYPIKFDFFVDRKLFSTQVRSPELPGAVGVDVGTDVATPPFNYAVVATVLHPNRSFTTVVNGAVFASDLVGNLDCSLTKPAAADGETDLFQANKVDSEQKGNDTVTLTYSATDDSGELEDDVVVSLTLATTPGASETGDITATGTVGTTGDGKDIEASVEGTVTFVDGSISEIEVANSDDTLSLACSESAAVE